MSEDAFADLWPANVEFVANFPHAELSGVAGKGLALVTCMDTRIEPLDALGLVPGDAKIIRTAGARVTDDVIRSIVLASTLLGVNRVLIMAHTNCGLLGDDDAVRAAVADALGFESTDPAITSFEPGCLPELATVLKADANRLRSNILIRSDLKVAAAVYDVATGKIDRVNLS